MSSLALIAGARPNFMKVAPLVRAFRTADLSVRLIHTGQHYDARMSQTFFDELNIPHPDVNLGVGSGSAVWQITEIMRRLEAEFAENRPEAVVVVGDVNSTLAAAVTAAKLDLPVAHVEAGLRSFDRTMPEESNRLVTDALSRWLFASEPAAVENLRREGVPAERVHFVGNVMIDTLYAHRERARAERAFAHFGLPEKGYALLTLHRPSNVDDPIRLRSILAAVHEITRELPVLFPVHPRTTQKLETFGFTGDPSLNGYQPIEPLGYVTMLGLMDAARLVLTDSGGIQEETTALGVPCLTLRENTERPATIDSGTNRLVGWQTESILRAARELLAAHEMVARVPELWDGHAAERIAAVLCVPTSTDLCPLTPAS